MAPGATITKWPHLTEIATPYSVNQSLILSTLRNAYRFQPVFSILLKLPILGSVHSGITMSVRGGTLASIGADRIFQSPCCCNECYKQYHHVERQKSSRKFQYSRLMSDSEIADLSRSYCTTLFEVIKATQGLCTAHGKSIAQKWLKTSNTKRKAHLKKLCPEFPKNQDAFLQRLNSQQGRQSSRDVYLLPYLTIDTLAKDETKILCLLRYRVFHTPDEWAAFDNSQIIAGWMHGAFAEEFHTGSINLSAKTYGKISAYNKTEGEFRFTPCSQNSSPWVFISGH